VGKMKTTRAASGTNSSSQQGKRGKVRGATDTMTCMGRRLAGRGVKEKVKSLRSKKERSSTQRYKGGRSRRRRGGGEVNQYDLKSETN